MHAIDAIIKSTYTTPNINKFDWTCAIYMGGRRTTIQEIMKEGHEQYFFWTIWILDDHGKTWCVQKPGDTTRKPQTLASCTRASSTIRALAPIMGKSITARPCHGLSPKIVNRIPKDPGQSKKDPGLSSSARAHLASMLQLLVMTVQVQKAEKCYACNWICQVGFKVINVYSTWKWITGRIINMPE